MNNESIYGLTFDQLTAWLLEHGHRKFWASQVWDGLYKKRVTDFSEMNNVNKECIQLLSDHFVIQTLNQHIMQESADTAIGGVLTHLRVKDSLKQTIPIILLGILSFIVFFTRLSDLSEFPGLTNATHSMTKCRICIRRFSFLGN